ncbi:WD40 repeat-like protein [Thozetella sp. PMI_491]|nr:WD40 repeat-like protein [Thozetella sp. PMI_491]
MGSAKLNGDAVALKKRKRDKNDERKGKKKQKQQGVVDSDEPTAQEPLSNSQVELSGDGDKEVAGPFQSRNTAPAWKLSKPMGGRMLDIDPVFSLDEQHIIVTYNTSIQIYSTNDSLLVRRISLPVTESPETTEFTGASIVATQLSKASPDLVWVACSDGRIWKINWTTGDGVDTPFTVDTKRLIDLMVDHITVKDKLTEVLFVLEKNGKKSGRIVAYDVDSLASKTGKTVHAYEDSPHLLRTALNGRLIAATASQAVHLGYLTTESRNIKTLADLEYQFVSFDVDDIITCLDIRCPAEGRKQKTALQRPVEMAIGFARGKILLFSDVLSTLPGKEKSASKKPPRPRKYHWHRRAVHSLKWSQDGNYLISGGSETVLVLWQLDTAKPDFLPHLSASIENIVVSPTGSSYALHLDDNSLIVLSTAEMKPTVYVSGIQSRAFDDQRAKDTLVKRVGQHFEGLTTPLTAIGNPSDPSQILLCVGNGQQASAGDGTQSTPLLQVFDLSTFHNTAKHAIARTNPADVNISSQGYPIIEPRVTQLAFSHDGKWLASVDEWEPPERDVEPIADVVKTAADFRHERREIYLKFWEVGSPGTSLPVLHLSSRVNDSHHTSYPEVIFDLAADPTSPRFATVGADGKVRFWTSKVRQSDGVTVTDNEGKVLRSWACSQIISLADVHQQHSDLGEEVLDSSFQKPQSGALAFSEDGSILFAALGGHSNTVYIIDAQSGAIRSRLYDLFVGDIRAIKSLGPCVITLSEDLNVYDLVADELRYGFSLSEISAISLPLAHLAVNPGSQSFAIAVTLKEAGKQKVKRGASSTFAIFSPEDRQPQLETTIPHVITSLLPATPSSGFVLVDSAAQVWTASEGPETATIAQPLADINLDIEDGDEQPGESALVLIGGESDADSDEEMADPEEDEQGDLAMDDYDAHASVITTQQLEDIYNSAPAWAMPSVEDVFFQVTALLAK